MNAEEMERSIEFLLKNQATLENQIERTSRQIEETNNRLEVQAETQTEFMKIVTQQIEAQGAINTSLRATLGRTDERINQTDARLDRLAALVEQHLGR
jgi:ribosome-binding ATPase YchF (GTP1/OBG family)